MIFGGEDEDTCGNRDTWGAAIAASAAVIQAVDAVLSGEARNAYETLRLLGYLGRQRLTFPSLLLVSRADLFFSLGGVFT